MLSKSHRGEKPAKQATKGRWHFSPTAVEKKLLFLLEKNKTPPTADT
jgi:hypothetical protein